MCACLVIRIDSHTHCNHYVIALAAVPRCRSSIRYAPVVRPRGMASPMVSSNVAARVTVAQPMDTGTVTATIIPAN
jgi:hypothetical protein